MLRIGILKNIKKHPDAKHILHIISNVVPIFTDIKNLEIVPLEGYNDNARKLESRKVAEGYKAFRLIELSDPCARYEIENIDFIDKSRQSIYAETIDPSLDISDMNYEFEFTNKEYHEALEFIDGRKCIGVHLRSAEKWRDYRYRVIKKKTFRMFNIAEEIAKRYDGYVIVFDTGIKYNPKHNNVIMCIDRPIRVSMAIMSLCIAGIGPDSFGIHAFGALDVPVYGIFGPTDPSIRMKYKTVAWPEKSGCEKQYCWYRYKECQSGISCLNDRTTKFYVDDFFEKLGGYIK